MRVERWRRASAESAVRDASSIAPDGLALIASAAERVHAAVAKRREAAQIRHGDNLYRRADEQHHDALCFYFGLVEAAFGRPATLPPAEPTPEPVPFVSTSTHCYRCNGTIQGVPCPDGKPDCEMFHHEHVCPRDEGSPNPALPPRHA